MSNNFMPAPTLEQRATRESQSLFKSGKPGTPLPAPRDSNARSAFKDTPSRATAANGQTYD